MSLQARGERRVCKSLTENERRALFASSSRQQRRLTCRGAGALLSPAPALSSSCSSFVLVLVLDHDHSTKQERRFAFGPLQFGCGIPGCCHHSIVWIIISHK